MSQPTFNTYGAVDLGALRPKPVQPAHSAQSAPAGADGIAGIVLDVTEATFSTEVIERSMTVPVVLDFWAEWCGPCKQLSPVLERLAVADGGRWVLAKIDVDAEQRLGAAFQVQSIPSVFAVIKGQPVPLFQGALPESQIRTYLDELLRVAATNGVTGRVEPGQAVAQTPADAPPAPPPLSPELEAAYDAIDRGDYDSAAAAYRKILADTPADEEARLGLAQVELLRRVGRLDIRERRRAAQADPSDVQAQCDVADLDLLDGQIEPAFARLVAAVRATTGEDRERARTHLVGLFEIVGPADPRVAASRRELARALF